MISPLTGPPARPGTKGQWGAFGLYPREITGFFTRRRTAVGWVLMVLFLGVPWLKWQGRPFLLFDVFGRKLNIGPWEFWPQDVRLFLPAVLAFVLGIFFVTARYGRIWCGWACPQTVFLQFLFAPLERLLEGRSSVRRKRDGEGFTWNRGARKILKHGIFLVLAVIIGNSALAYFWGMHNLLWALQRPPSENWAGFVFMGGFSLAFYFVFAWFKEKACTIVCPYAKFQSVLTDRRSLVIAYDPGRGEARGKAKGRVREGLGDCVDCGFCVQVCPTGIDIRDGQQLECIGCARCLDACDKIMDAWKMPRGLVRYATLNELEGEKSRGIAWRPWIYGALSLGLAVVFFAIVLGRPPFSVDAKRIGSEPFLIRDDGAVTNHFSLKVHNNDNVRHIYRIILLQAADFRHNWESRDFAVGAGQNAEIPIDIIVPEGAITGGKREIAIRIHSDGHATQKKVYLMGPEKRKNTHEK